MRRSLSVVVMIGLMAATNPPLATASPAGNSPYCLKGCDAGGEGIGACSFSS
jgi:hypothetical protein